MQIKAVIVDDEQHSLETTDILIRKYCPGILITGLADSPEKGIALIDALKPDLVFLDIAMPRMNGFEMLQFVQFKNFEIIFTTAFDAYAIKAFKVNAMDYLLKPIEPEELIRAVEKVKVKIEKSQQLNRIDEILQNSAFQGLRKNKLALPVDGKISMIEFDSILYCESDGNYTRIYLTDKKRFMISKTLKDIENLLPQTDFLRIHHSYVVNINHIKEYIRGEGGEVLMSNGEVLRVSRNKKEELLSILFG